MQPSPAAADPTTGLSAMSQTMQELSQAVRALSDTVARLSKADLDEMDKEIVESEASWERVRDTIKEQDRETVESWKDELNNLLVFAGLFSAVVTAFTVESYTWLQQDPVDASNLLLARLSLQLSALTVVYTNSNLAVPTFINSTAPGLSLSDVSSSFVPVSYAVSVNILWVLSLTLSLVSAFFAIAVQQWLRQLYLPPDMPVRRAVQLLSFRKDGIKTWQLPSIISLLPLLLQIAVVLFLAGLFLILQSLNVTLAIVFTVVALVALLAFIATTVVPLFTIHCPYKSPIVPTVLVVLQCITHPLAIMVLPVVSFLKYFLFTSLGQSLVNASPRYGWYSWRHADRCIHDFYNDTLLPYIKCFGRHIFVDLSQFWMSREYQHMLSQNQDEQVKLERTSLVQTLLSLPIDRLPELLQSLSFGAEEWTYTFRDVVMQNLLAFRSGLKWEDLISNHVLKSKMAPYIRRWLSARHRQLFLRHVQRGTEISRHVDSELLIVLHELDQAVASTPRRYVKHLINTCVNQQISKDHWAGEIVPSCLLLDVILERNYTLDTDDIASIHGFTSKFHETLHDRAADIDACRLLCVVTTLTLITCCQCTTRTTSSTNVPKIVKMFAEYLDKDMTKASLKESLQKYYDEPGMWTTQYPLSMSLPKVQRALCKALADYTSVDTCPLNASHLQDLERISDVLHHVYSDPYLAAKNVIQDAFDHLRRLNITLRGRLLAASENRLLNISMHTGESSRPMSRTAYRPQTWCGRITRTSDDHSNHFDATDEMTLKAACAELRMLDSGLKHMDVSRWDGVGFSHNDQHMLSPVSDSDPDVGMTSVSPDQLHETSKMLTARTL